MSILGKGQTEANEFVGNGFYIVDCSFRINGLCVVSLSKKVDFMWSKVKDHTFFTVGKNRIFRTKIWIEIERGSRELGRVAVFIGR